MPEAEWISRDQALIKAKDFLRQQSWSHEFDEQTARVIESNECINVLFRYREPRKPPEILVSVEKIGGKVDVVKLG